MIKDLATYNSHSEITLVGPLYQGDASFKDPVIFVDGGSRYRENNQGLSIGDGDSSDGELDILLNQDKNFSDLSYVLDILTENFKTIHLLGFLGGRKDHELINLGEASHFLENKNETSVIFDKGIIAYSSGARTINLNGTFSLFSFSDNEIEITGNCHYEYKGILKAHSSHGLSNVGNGEINLENQRPIFLLS